MELDLHTSMANIPSPHTLKALIISNYLDVHIYFRKLFISIILLTSLKCISIDKSAVIFQFALDLHLIETWLINSQYSLLGNLQ